VSLSLFSTFVSTLDMVRYWKKHISMKDMSSGILPTYLFLIFYFFFFFTLTISLLFTFIENAFINIKLKHSIFTRLSMHYSNIMVILMSEFVANLMVKSKKFFLDGTFNMIECKLVLIILLALVDNIIILCTYLLSKLCITKTYKWFFNIYILFSFSFIIFCFLFHYSLFYFSLTLIIIRSQIGNQETDVAKNGVFFFSLSKSW
jgi:hypothetical protein